MEIKNIIFILVFLASFGFLFYSLSRKLSYLKLGVGDDRFGSPGNRIKNVFKIAFGQSKLLRDPVAGTIHFLIFWGFMLFLFAVIESIIQGFYTPFSLEFLGPFFSVITVVQDLFGVLVFVAVIWAIFRRFVQKIDRLEVEKAGKMDALLILLLILMVVVSMFLQNSAALALNGFQPAEYEFRPISSAFSNIIFENNAYSAKIIFEISWWTHILVIFFFMNFLPYSKHFHVFTSIPNVFFQKLGREKFSLKPLDLEDEEAEQFGVADVEHLSWKQLLDGFACTECGRCAEACPAASTGKLLSPRKIIVDIRHRLEEKAPILIKNSENSQDIVDKTLVNHYISSAELWACTTCGACVQECPVTIEHIDSIVDMRRNLVLMESQFPAELNSLFKNLETNFSPWAFNAQDRAEWADGLEIKTMAEDSNCDYLYWVGCAGSFDARYQKVSRAFAQLMRRGGVDFRILGAEEKCNGDTARRLGNEYLAQTLMQENIETLNGYGVKKIVTACPHCYNSLKNEYPQFGGEFEVIHHSEMIKELLDSGKLELSGEKRKEKVTFHDSCYLGRYNGIYEEPRSVIESVTGEKVIEMNRKEDKGFCCGAGGGRMFLEETEGKRINEERTEEAIATGAETVASACPFCMTMLNDGLKTIDNTDLQVKDIAEVVLENIK